MQLPNEFDIRPYQEPLWEYMTNGGKRAVCVWHRRAGKDLTAAHFTAYEAARNPGNYWHMFPMSIQGRTALWNKVDKGKRVIDTIFPPSYVERRSDVNMTLKLTSGSTWQILGSDNYENSIGANPRGIVFSEYSLTDPNAWEYMRPILRENGGWAIFIFTPRWINHGYDLLQQAKGLDDWFWQICSVRDTDMEHLAKAELRDGMPEELVAQEYYCSFTSMNMGTIYARQMEDAEREERLTKVPHDAAGLVDTYWDLGYKDATAIWFVQRVGYEIHLIDYIEDSFRTVAEYADLLRGDTTDSAFRKKYRYGVCYLPHDARQRTLAAGGVSIEEQMRTLGFETEVVGSAPLTEAGFVRDRIDATRRILPRCWFDRERTARGIKALQSYCRKWDSDRKVFSDRPEHGWESHGSDAFGVMAIANERERQASRNQARRPLVYPADHVSNVVI